MAHYKMCVQLRDQSRAFFHGFREFIHRDWLGMFSGPELQKLISGDSTTLDVSDLRYLVFIDFSCSQYDLNWIYMDTCDSVIAIMTTVPNCCHYLLHHFHVQYLNIMFDISIIAVAFWVHHAFIMQKLLMYFKGRVSHMTKTYTT